MTFQEMYNLAMALWDKAGSPYLPEEQFDAIANTKYNDWIENMAKQFEKDENLTERLRWLLKKYTKNNSSFINLKTEVPDFRRRFRFYGKFSQLCDGQTQTFEVNIMATSNDEIDEMKVDPFNSPTDREPLFISDVNGLGEPIMQVFSTTTPVQMVMTYMREPQKINVANSPSTIFEAPDYIAQEIVMMIVKAADGITENFNRVQTDSAELGQRMASL